MSNRDLRKTVIIPNLTMQELVSQYPLSAFPNTTPEPRAKVPVMDETALVPDAPRETMADAPRGPVADPINPDYYKADGIEVIQIIEAFKLDYHRASALKYLLRAGNKEDAIQDMKKCAWFVERRVKVLEGKK
jgi:hypothetical protein